VTTAPVTGWTTRLTQRIAPLLPARLLLAFWSKLLL
jgi:hypothetical protein